MRSPLGTVLFALVLPLAACGDSSMAASLSSVIVSDPPSGYTAQTVANGDDLSIDDAASATPADPGAVKTFLQSSSWRGTQVRVWVDGTSYAEDVGFAFASAGDATRFDTLEVNALRADSTDYVYSLAPQLPAGEGFILYSQTRVGNRNVFCNGAWLPAGDDVFELLTCGATPQDSRLAVALATEQLRRTGGTPGPAPT